MTGSPRLPIALLAAAIVAAVPALAQATSHGHAEDFATKQYCDRPLTTAEWDTVGRVLRLPALAPAIVGGLATTGARGVALAGDYAYVADVGTGLRVINIGNPASPTPTATFDTPGLAYAVAVSGNYAYVADYSAGLRVINISNPAAPTSAGAYDTPGSAYGVAIDGDYAFVADGASGVQVIDITNPAAPTLAATYDTPSIAHKVTIDGDYAYVADHSTGLIILDIANPAAPALVGTCDTPGAAYAVALYGEIACVADFTMGMAVIDIRDRAQPTLVGRIATPSQSMDVTVDGGYAYVADYSSGVQVVDINDPAHPSIVASCDWVGAGNARAIVLAGDRAFVAGETQGLQVMKIMDPVTPTPLGNYETNLMTALALSGRYAYTANVYDGLGIYDISDPAHPAPVGTCDTEYAAGVDIAGTYAYVADYEAGLRIIDISDPTRPAIVATYVTPSAAYDVTINGNYAYVASQSAGVQIVNISNPLSPTLAGSYATPGWAWKVAVDGDYAYVADYHDGLIVLNVTNPASPTLAGSCATTGDAKDVAVAGDYAYVGAGAGGLDVINISNPANPVHAGGIATPGDVYSVCLRGDRAYVAAAHGGLHIFNIDIPWSPGLVASYVSPGSVYGVAVAGGIAFVAEEFGSGLVAIQVGNWVDTTENLARSLAVNAPAGAIVRARLEAMPTGTIAWGLSLDGGSSFQPIAADGAWHRLTGGGQTLLWRGTLADVASRCSQLRVSWLMAPALIDSVRDIPGDQGGRVRVRFSPSGYDVADEATHPITGYNIWRRVDDVLLQARIAKAAATGAADAPSSPALAGLPVVDLGGRIFLARGADKSATFPPGTWEVVGSLYAAQQDAYTIEATTLADSAAANAWAVYCVSTHTTTPGTWYVSPPDSGYSVDNLAPHAPTGFAVAYGGDGNALTWEPCPDRDFEYFNVYRGASGDFVPAPANRVQATIGTGWLDPSPDEWAHHYKITAVDHAGNESAPVAPGSMTGIGPAAPRLFALRQNVPNPFNPSTTIRYELPAAGRVRLVIYDARGRLVRTLVDGQQDAPGMKTAIWDGRDGAGRGVASGSYYARLTCGSEARTIRMSLVR